MKVGEKKNVEKHKGINILNKSTKEREKNEREKKKK